MPRAGNGCSCEECLHLFGTRSDDRMYEPVRQALWIDGDEARDLEYLTTDIPEGGIDTPRNPHDQHGQDLLRLRYRAIGRDLPDERPIFDVLASPSRQPGYAAALSQAFAFFRRNADRRYSDKTLMRLVRAADRLSEAASGDSRDPSLPLLTVASLPVEYDELTEEKRGGAVGMTATWPERDGLTILAVAPPWRRQGYGSVLIDMVRYWYDEEEIHLWVGRNNCVGQKFLLSNRLLPTAISSSGAVRYADHEAGADEREGDRGPELGADGW